VNVTVSAVPAETFAYHNSTRELDSAAALVRVVLAPTIKPAGSTLPSLRNAMNTVQAGKFTPPFRPVIVSFPARRRCLRSCLDRQRTSHRLRHPPPASPRPAASLIRRMNLRICRRSRLVQCRVREACASCVPLRDGNTRYAKQNLSPLVCPNHNRTVASSDAAAPMPLTSAPSG
jgi:hypothetical protein